MFKKGDKVFYIDTGCYVTKPTIEEMIFEEEDESGYVLIDDIGTIYASSQRTFATQEESKEELKNRLRKIIKKIEKYMEEMK